MRRTRRNAADESPVCYPTFMSAQDDNNLLNFIATTVEALRDQIATKGDIVRLESRMDTMRDEMATKDELATLRDQTKEVFTRVESTLREQMATKNDMGRLETTMHGEFERVHIRLDSIDRGVDTRMGHLETDISRLRSVLYLLVKDKPDMLRLLGQPTRGESRPQG